MALLFEEPETIKIGEEEICIVPLPTEDMKLALEFIEITAELSEARKKITKKVTKKATKQANKGKKPDIKKLSKESVEVNKIIFDELMPLCGKIVGLGLVYKDDMEKPYKLPRQYLSVTKLMEISALILKATTDLDLDVDINLPKIEGQ